MLSGGAAASTVGCLSGVLSELVYIALVQIWKSLRPTGNREAPIPEDCKNEASALALDVQSSRCSCMEQLGMKQELQVEESLSAAVSNLQIEQDDFKREWEELSRTQLQLQMKEPLQTANSNLQTAISNLQTKYSEFKQEREEFHKRKQEPQIDLSRGFEDGSLGVSPHNAIFKLPTNQHEFNLAIGDVEEDLKPEASTEVDESDSSVTALHVSDITTPEVESIYAIDWNTSCLRSPVAPRDMPEKFSETTDSESHGTVSHPGGSTPREATPISGIDENALCSSPPVQSSTAPKDITTMGSPSSQDSPSQTLGTDDVFGDEDDASLCIAICAPTKYLEPGFTTPREATPISGIDANALCSSPPVESNTVPNDMTTMQSPSSQDSPSKTLGTDDVLGNDDDASLCTANPSRHRVLGESTQTLQEEAKVRAKVQSQLLSGLLPDALDAQAWKHVSSSGEACLKIQRKLQVDLLKGLEDGSLKALFTGIPKEDSKPQKSIDVRSPQKSNEFQRSPRKPKKSIQAKVQFFERQHQSERINIYRGA